MPSQIIPILLAGGAGTRLWPVSRDALPKQFLPLIGTKSTYQETLLRVQDAMFAPPIVITGPKPGRSRPDPPAVVRSRAKLSRKHRMVITTSSGC